MNEEVKEEEPRELTKLEREVEALKVLYYARRCIEQAGNAIVSAAQALKSPRPSNAIKLLERGWGKAEESLSRKIRDDAHNIFAIELTKELENANTEEESNVEPGGDGEGEEGGDPDGNGCPPPGVCGGGDDAEPVEEHSVSNEEGGEGSGEEDQG